MITSAVWVVFQDILNVRQSVNKLYERIVRGEFSQPPQVVGTTSEGKPYIVPHLMHATPEEWASLATEAAGIEAMFRMLRIQAEQRASAKP